MIEPVKSLNFSFSSGPTVEKLEHYLEKRIETQESILKIILYPIGLLSGCLFLILFFVIVILPTTNTLANSLGKEPTHRWLYEIPQTVSLFWPTITALLCSIYLFSACRRSLHIHF